MPNSLGGKVVVITGASSGIGAATALALAPHGAKLVLGARRKDKLEATAARVRAAGAASKCECLTRHCDVAQRDDVRELVETAVELFGRLDIMVANAGYGMLAKVHEMSEETFDELFQVNVKGSWYAMQEAAAAMLPRKSGHIIVISSAAARRGLPLYGAYSMTKAAQLSLVEAMRVELLPMGIYVSSVHPVTTATEFFETASQRSRIKSSGLGKAQTAESVGRKIVRLMARPKPELWPHSLSRLGLSFATMFPRMTDKAMLKLMPRRRGETQPGVSQVAQGTPTEEQVP